MSVLLDQRRSRSDNQALIIIIKYLSVQTSLPKSCWSVRLLSEGGSSQGSAHKNPTTVDMQTRIEKVRKAFLMGDSSRLFGKCDPLQ